MTKSLVKSTRFATALLVMLLMFFPMYWMLITAVKSSTEVRLAVPTFWPKAFEWHNFGDALQAAPYGRYAVNTIVQTAGIVFLQINIAIMAAFAFAKGRFWGRDKLFILVLAALIVPEQVTFVPTYVMMSKMNWINTFYALILPHAASAYGIFLLRQTFRSINNDVVEAAKVDGATRMQVLYRILTPMALPTVSTLIVLLFVFAQKYIVAAMANSTFK